LTTRARLQCTSRTSFGSRPPPPLPPMTRSKSPLRVQREKSRSTSSTTARMRPKPSIICVQCCHADGFLHLRVRYGHITKMAEAMAAAITVCITHQPYFFCLVICTNIRIFSFFSFTLPQASGNDAAIFQVLHTTPTQPTTKAAQQIQDAARNPHI
jgi:hypothetical protein